jgi:UDP-glucose 4-epimerase
MNVLITGGAGFIGSHLAEAYLRRGDNVAIIDDLSTGRIDNISHLNTISRFQCVINDAANRSCMEKLVDTADVIFHLAAAVGVKLVVEHPMQAIQTNLKTTEVVLDLAAEQQKKVILTSTSEVYGNSNAVPFRETDNMVLGPSNVPRWAYACTKALDEFKALAYHRERDLPAVVVRLFNTVGPRQTGRYGMVLPRFIEQAMAGTDITVHGDGRQRRCFSHVSDVVRCLMALAEKEEAVGNVINIGSQHEISILDLARRVRDLAESRSRIVFLPYQKVYGDSFEDIRRRVPDTSRLRRLISFAPDRTVDDVIASLLEHRGVYPTFRYYQQEAHA